jgi:hypothetical protein
MVSKYDPLFPSLCFLSNSVLSVLGNALANFENIKFCKKLLQFTEIIYILSDSYPAFFLPIATTSNKKI